jgi:hypothetical protein
MNWHGFRFAPLILLTYKMCVMKAGKFTIAILFCTTIFISCSKDKSISNDSQDNPVRSTATLDKFSYISDWEGGNSWTLSDSASYKIYLHEKNIPELTGSILANGAVLVWARNYAKDNGERMSKPQLLPIHVLPEQGRPAYDNYWYYLLNDSKITVKYRTNKYLYAGGSTFIPLPDSDVQLRYFVLSADDLAAAGYNQNTVRQLSYDQLVDKFGTGY